MFRNLFQNSTARQSALLFSAQIGNALLGFLVVILNTSLLTVDEFGIYSFFISTTLFLGLFFDFGFFSAGSRLLAAMPFTPERLKERNITGALIVVAAVICLSFGLLLIGFSFAIDRIFGTHVGSLLFILTPIIAFVPLQNMLTFIFRGTNEIGKLSIHILLPRLLYVTAIGIALLFGIFSMKVSIIMNFASMALVFVILILTTQPSFKKLGTQVKILFQETREYGMHVYAGSIVDNMTVGSDKLVITYILGATRVGLYSVAQSLTMPISMLGRAVSFSVFKKFAHSDRIPRRLLRIVNIWVLTFAIFIAVGNETFVRFVFSERYIAGMWVIPLLCIGMAFSGWNQLYHSFLSARREGKAMRNISMWTSGLNVLADVCLIPILGLVGAALADDLTQGFDFFLSRWYYNQTQNRSVVLEVQEQ